MCATGTAIAVGGIYAIENDDQRPQQQWQCQ